MGSPLGHVLANIFMVHLENQVVPQMSDKVASWGRYVDDTFTFVKADCIDDVIETLNGFHTDIKFTHEVGKEGRIAFLDVLVQRKNDGSFETSVFRKKSDTHLYINWKAFAPRSWKLGTLKGIIRRAFLICSEEDGLKKEINHIKEVFIDINGYPKKVVHGAINEMERKLRSQAEQAVLPSVANTSTQEEFSFPYMSLPYKGQEGENILKRLKNKLVKCLPKNVKPRISFNGKKLGSFFRVKDKIKEEHQTDLVYRYHDKFNTENHQKEVKYVGETKVRYGTRTYQHINTDKNSAVFKYLESNGLEATHNNFEIVESGFNKAVDRKLAEALYIKDLKPVLNEQTNSFKLLLFN